MKIYKVKFQVPFLMMHHGSEIPSGILLRRLSFKINTCGDRDSSRQKKLIVGVSVALPVLAAAEFLELTGIMARIIIFTNLQVSIKGEAK